MANHEGLNQYSPEDAQEEAGELQAKISQEQAANQAAKEEMIAWLTRGNINDAIEIKEQFALSEEVFQAMIIELIDTGQGNKLAQNLSQFKELNPAITEKLIENGYLLNVVQNFNVFNDNSGVIHQAILKHLNLIVESDDLADSVVENFPSLKLNPDQAFKVLLACITHYSTAQKVKQLDLLEYLSEENTKLLY